MKVRKQTEYWEIVGITEDNEIVMLDYIFKDKMHGKPFNGATGTIFVPVTQDDIDARNDFDQIKDDYSYLWTEAVATGATEDSLDDYIQSLIDNADGYFFGHDTSYINKIPETFRKKYFPDAETFECIGGGRCFGRHLKFKVILRPDLLKKINKVEES